MLLFRVNLFLLCSLARPVIACEVPAIPVALKAQALEVYNTFPFPALTSSLPVVLNTDAFDGVGDLEHLIAATRALRAQGLQVKIYLISEQEGLIVEEKLAALLSCTEDVMLIGRAAANEDDDDQKFYDPAQVLCVMDISTNFVDRRKISQLLPLIGVQKVHERYLEGKLRIGPEVDGHVPEYIGLSLSPLGLSSFNTGLLKDSLGIWISSDPILGAIQTDLVFSESTHQALFGDLAEEPSSWSVGFGSFRSEEALEAWIRIRLKNIEKKSTCLVMPKGIELPSPDILADIAAEARFHQAIVYNSETGQEEVFFRSNKPVAKPRILRLVPYFVPEDDIGSLYQLASKGSMAAAGDTSMARGLLAEKPLVVDVTNIKDRVQEMANYCLELGYPDIAQWFGSCVKKNYTWLYKNADSLTLQHEWEQLRSVLKTSHDLSPRFVAYTKRCMLAHRHGEDLKTIERGFLVGTYSKETYENLIRSLWLKEWP